ncbi:MAG: peptidoglycan-binding domain-containing protein [bacterium]
MNIKKFAGVSLVAMFAIASVAGATTYTFTKTLKQGSKGADVKNLQKFLNECPDTKVTAAGKETTSFGAGTKKAVIAFQKKNGLPTTGTFGPASAAAAVKAQAAKDVCAPIVASTTTGSTTSTGTTTTVTGPISVALSSDNPAAGTVVAGQATADLMHVTFTGTGTVNSVTLSRGGISDSSTLSAVYLYDGVTRLTDGYSFNTAGTLTINNLNIAVNGSKTISVKADVYGSTTSYDIYTTLTGFSVGTSASTVAIKGNDFYVASGTGTLASISLSGTQQVSTNASVNAGQTNYAVWRQAFQVNTRALSLKAANFRISGSAPADALANVGLYIDGVKTGNNASMTSMNGSNYLSFDMSAMPVSLSTGTHTVEVRADVVKGSSFSFTVSLQQASDLMVMDPQVGVNLTISSFTASTAGTITIGAGSYTVNNDVKFNSLTNITAGVSNAVIAKYTVHGYGENVKVTSINVTPVLAGTVLPGGAAGLQNVALFFNGSQIGANTANWTSGAITFTPGSQLMIPANADSTIEVHADLRNTSGVSYTGGIVSANLGSIVSEGFNSHSNVTAPSLPSGHTLTMQAGALTVAKNGNYSNQTVSSNAIDQKIGSFVFQNTSSSDSVRVTSLLVNPIGTGSALTTDLSGLKVAGTFSDGTVAFAPTSPQQPASSNTFSVDFTLTPGQTATIDVLASTNSNNNINVIPTLVATAISSNIGVSQNGNGTAVIGQTITINSGSLTNSATTPSFLASNSTPTSYLASPAGKVDATKATYSFSATGGAATISELKFQVTGSDASPSYTVTSVKVGTVSAPVVGGVAWLQNLSIPVANGGTGTNIDAYVSYSTVGQAGTASVTSGVTSSIALYMVKYTSGGVTTTLGNGGTAFTNGSLSSNTVTLAAATPTVKKTSSPTSVGVGTTTNLKVGTIAVTANDGDITIGVIPVNFSSLGTNANWTVKVNGTVPTGVVVTQNNTSALTFANGYQISKGNTVSFDLYADVTNSGTSSGNVDVSLGANASFKWSDIIDGTTTSASMTKTGTNLTTYNQ